MVSALSLVCCATGLDCVVGHWQDTRGLALNVAAFEHLHHLQSVGGFARAAEGGLAMVFGSASQSDSEI